VLPRDGSITDLFLGLVSIPSPSGRERALGEQVRDWLAAAGVPAQFDGSGARNHSDAGNLVAAADGAPGAPRLLFVAHLDTVESGEPAVRPVLGDDGIIRSASDTILGADNKSAVAAVMRLCAAVRRMPATRRAPLAAAFTCREESGRMGAGFLDLAGLGVDCAFCVDGAQPIGTVITRALGQTTFELTVRGRAAHAAAAPERGVDAIAVAAEIVGALPLGRLPAGGSANVAAIVGGSVIDRLDRAEDRGPGTGAGGLARAALAAAPTNSVPDIAHLRGEIRGFTVAEIEATVAEVGAVAERVCAARGARYQLRRDRSRMIPPLPGRPDSRALSLVRTAAAGVAGVRFAATEAHATLEANHLAAAADVVAVASGGRDPHQRSESIAVAELEQLEALLTGIAVAAAA